MALTDNIESLRVTGVHLLWPVATTSTHTRTLAAGGLSMPGH